MKRRRVLLPCALLIISLAVIGWQEMSTPVSNDEPPSTFGSGSREFSSDAPLVSTFSIVAYDPQENSWGVAVASRYLAVGSIVPWAAADAGAIATQSYANTDYGVDGLALLRSGKSAEEVLKILTDADDGRARRQVGIVDLQGRSATYTGEDCHPWAGGRTGPHYTCQGNILTGPEVIDAMAKAFEEESGPLAWRMQAALSAGDEAGGDRRGRQAAGLLVVRPPEEVNKKYDRIVDLRVDDHPAPVRELGRLLQLKSPRESQPETE